MYWTFFPVHFPVLDCPCRVVIQLFLGYKNLSLHVLYTCLKKKTLLGFNQKMSRIWRIFDVHFGGNHLHFCQPESQKMIVFQWFGFHLMSWQDRKRDTIDMKVLSKLNRKEMTGKIKGNDRQLQPASEHEAAPLQSPRHYFIGHRSIWTSVCFTTLKNFRVVY